MKRVVVVIFDQAQLLDLAGPLDAIAAANQALILEARPEAYRIEVASLGGGLIMTGAGLGVASQRLTEVALGADCLLVVGGPGVFAAADDPAFLAEIRRHAARAGRICAVCTGAFVLAAAGLLAGRRVTTHWLYAEQLMLGYPDLAVEPDSIFIEDGPIWTSAGVSAGIDLTLAVIERDLGRELAMRAARLLVVFLKRPGGQSQFSAALSLQSADHARFADLHDWMRQNLSGDLRIERLAEFVGMTPRTFSRLYVAQVGQTPAKNVETIRIEAARLALEDSATSIKQIARDVGFGDDERMRRAFLRQLGVAPADYRERFAAARPGLAA